MESHFFVSLSIADVEELWGGSREVFVVDVIATLLSIPLYNLAGRLATNYGPVQILSTGICTRIMALVALGVVTPSNYDCSPGEAQTFRYCAKGEKMTGPGSLHSAT